MTAVPQRPRLTFAVGITGHRPNKLSASILTRAESQLAAVFAAIDVACAERLARDACCYAEAPHRVRLVSSFAEGIDQLAVRMRPAHWEVTAILPFPRARYEEDFVARDERGTIVSDRRLEFASALREAGEVVELPEQADGAPAHYARAGAFMLRQIDLLVAVWDGAEAAGKGGTAHVVAAALEGGLPVVWIASARDQPPWLIEHMTDVDRETPLADASLGPVAQAVDTAIGVDPAPSRRLQDFLAEEPREHENATLALRLSGWLAHIGSLGKSLPTRALPDITKDWAGFLEQSPESGSFKARLEELLLPRFAVTEALAEDYARAGRGADLLFYLLAFVAVAIALLGAWSIGTPSDTESTLVLEAFLAFLELLVVGAILATVRTDEKGRWRERSFDYRALAEGLRHLRFLAPVGECANHPPRRGAPSSKGDWVFWYLRATIRELGSPVALLDAGYQRKLLLATESAEIDKGLAWHRDNAKRLGGLQLTMLHMAEACFLATAALLGIFLALFIGWLGLRLAMPWLHGEAPTEVASWDERLLRLLSASKPFVILFAALLPGVGAIIAATRLVARLERTADRSAQAVALLRGLKSDYAVARERLELEGTAITLLDTARVEAEPVDACRSFYGRKRLTLPV